MGLYHYGYQGKERDDEIKGSGNSYDFGARMLDTRLGRWFSLDKEGKSQPGWSPYKGFNDNPIIFKDPDGNTEILTINYVKGNERLTFKIYMSDEVKVRMNLDNGLPYAHDINHTINIYENEDGTFKIDYHFNEAGKRLGIWIPFKYGSHKRKGGMVLLSINGKKVEDFTEEQVETMQIDDLLGLIGGAKGPGSFKIGSSFLGGLKTIFNATSRVLSGFSRGEKAAAPFVDEEKESSTKYHSVSSIAKKKVSESTKKQDSVYYEIEEGGKMQGYKSSKKDYNGSNGYPEKDKRVKVK